jgi:hypothetical protein
MESLSSQCSLRAPTIHSCLEVKKWLPACVPAWGQLQELHVPNDVPLQALAALPNLHTLHCNFHLRGGGAGRLHLPSLQHLVHCGYLPQGSPAELAAVSAPQLKTVEGLHRFELSWPIGDEEQEDFIVDIARAADGILQWVPKICFAGQIGKQDVQGRVWSALHRWQPVQGIAGCGLDLRPWYLRTGSLVKLPPAVQLLWWVTAGCGWVHQEQAGMCTGSSWESSVDKAGQAAVTAAEQRIGASHHLNCPHWAGGRWCASVTASILEQTCAVTGCHACTGCSNLRTKSSPPLLATHT